MLMRNPALNLVCAVHAHAQPRPLSLLDPSLIVSPPHLTHPFHFLELVVMSYFDQTAGKQLHQSESVLGSSDDT
jgi:hypothetical protein